MQGLLPEPIAWCPAGGCRRAGWRGRERGEGEGLADTELFWVAECQARKLSGSITSTWTSRRESLHLENVRSCVQGEPSVRCWCGVQLRAGAGEGARASLRGVSGTLGWVRSGSPRGEAGLALRRRERERPRGAAS